MPGIVEEDVVGFDISMDDALFMERLDGQDLRRAGGAFRILLEEGLKSKQDVRVAQSKIWRVRGRGILYVPKELIDLHDCKKAARRRYITSHRRK